ncbi:hypothetical protein, partial [Kocuria sp. NPDC057446]|uniref:hypothetical protein n=1 Tax=Kocuria sp. NPDC057446 TaxID=3346137 RepID=UPI00368B1EDC
MNKQIASEELYGNNSFFHSNLLNTVIFQSLVTIFLGEGTSNNPRTLRKLSDNSFEVRSSETDSQVNFVLSTGLSKKVVGEKLAEIVYNKFQHETYGGEFLKLNLYIADTESENPKHKLLVDLYGELPPLSEFSSHGSSLNQFSAPESKIKEFWNSSIIQYVDMRSVDVGHLTNLNSTEAHSIQELITHNSIDPEGVQDALNAIRNLISSVLQPDTEGVFSEFDRNDVRGALFLASRNFGDAPPFRIIERGFLTAESRRKIIQFEARPATWADVVQGPGPGSRFIERAATQPLMDVVRRCIVAPLLEQTDMRLPALFVHGAPGSGKSTIVRRVLADMVTRGEVFVMDLGVNHGAISPEDSKTYMQAIGMMAQSGRPVILLMDDPLFANSGWADFLKKLARRIQSRGHVEVGIIAASPTFLLDAYGYAIRDHHIHRVNYELEAPSVAEREDLAAAFGRDPSYFKNREDDFIVLAMEAAADTSFDDIIARIWSTLNDGNVIDSRVRPDQLLWLVRALMVVAYFHRFSMSCPVELLVKSLSISDKMENFDDYVQQLSEMELAEGWSIFRITTENGPDGELKVVSTIHARVAQRIWELRPSQGFDVAEWVIPASLKLSNSGPFLAHIANVGSRTSDRYDRGFVSKLFSPQGWDNMSVSTRNLCRLTRSIDNRFNSQLRHVLRKRMNREDAQSWLAAWELGRIARRGSSEHSHIREVKFPYHLRRGNLSCEPRIAIQVARNKNYTEVAKEQMIDSLLGLSRWKLADPLVSWLISIDSKLLLNHLTDFKNWFSHAEVRHESVLALVSWYKSMDALMDESVHEFVLNEVGMWVGEAHVAPENVFFCLGVFDKYTRSMAKCNNDLLSAIMADFMGWADAVDDSERVLIGMLSLKLSDSACINFREIVLTNIHGWVRSHSEDVIVRTKLLGVVEGLGKDSPVPLTHLVTETHQWLQTHPEDLYVRIKLLGVVEGLGKDSPVPLTHLVTETHQWLQTHPE